MEIRNKKKKKKVPREKSGLCDEYAVDWGVHRVATGFLPLIRAGEYARLSTPRVNKSVGDGERELAPVAARR